MPHDLTRLEAARAYERREAASIPAGDRPAFHLTPPVGWMQCWAATRQGPRPHRLRPHESAPGAVCAGRPAVPAPGAGD